MEIDINKMMSIDNIPVNKEDKKSIYMFAQEAKRFLLSHKWCRKIINGYVGLNLDGILGVFYFEIEPSSDNVDKKLWVITGDLPPAYLVTDRISNPPCAIVAYVEEMEAWVKAARNKKPLKDVIPVNVPPEQKYVDMLEKRLLFLRRNVISKYSSKELQHFYE